MIAVTAGTVMGQPASASEDVPRAENIILIIGDGMGLAHLAAAIYHSDEPYVLEHFPVMGFQKVQSLSGWITDSGAAATSMACGVKVYNTAVGVDQDTMPCTNLFDHARAAGKSTGIIVTSSLVHATPAGFLAHQAYRGLYEQIASDIIEKPADYMVGGGEFYFTDRFSDDRNLRDEIAEKGYFVRSHDQMTFKRFTRRYPKKCLYFTAQAEPPKRIEGRKYLPEAVKHGTECLTRASDDGFVLIVEGSQIDFACHDNDIPYFFSEMEDFHEAISAALDFAVRDGKTLVVVTSDHSCGGLYIEKGDPRKNNVSIEFNTQRHTADMVPVFAYGPGCELFGGIYDNTEIFHRLRRVGKF